MNLKIILGFLGFILFRHDLQDGIGRYKYYETYVENMTENKINPNHYHPHGIMTHEPIEVMKYMMSADAYRGYLVGNIIKYVSRYDKKNGIEDLEKAKKYIEFLEADMQGYSPMYAQNKEEKE